MKKALAIARSFEEADRADRDYYRSLTPLERLEILLELNRHWPTEDVPPPEVSTRVCQFIYRPR